MKTETILAILCASLISGCVATRDLSKPAQVGEDPFGSYIKVRLKTTKVIGGELIAIDSAGLALLNRKTGQCASVPMGDISHFKVFYARPRHYGWGIPVFTLLCLTHGYFGVFTIPFNLIVTISVTATGENDFTYSDRKMTFENLKMFARFPQGLPPGVDIKDIK